MLADTFPPKKRGMAFALYGVAVVVAPAIGPTLGGYITDNYSWHWIFLINVPVGHHFAVTLSHFVLKTPQAEIDDRDKLQQARHPRRLYWFRTGRALPRGATSRTRQGRRRRLVRLDVHHHVFAIVSASEFRHISSRGS